MNESDNSPKNQPDAEPADASADAVAEREKTFSRRVLIHAGWVTPLVVAMALPARAIAQSGHVDTTGFFDDNGGFCDGGVTDHCDIILSGG